MAHPILTCEYCQKPFEARNAKPSYRPRFCSRQCHGKSKRAAVVLVQCVQCRLQFPRKTWHAEKTKGRGPFCGFQCYADWQKENMKGQNNPAWTGQSDNDRGSAHYHSQRQKALERDGRRCRACGAEDDLEAHHKIPWAPNQESPHALGNLATLCGKCHRRLHYLQRRVRALEKLKAQLNQLSLSIR